MEEKLMKYKDKKGFVWDSKEAYMRYLAADQRLDKKTRDKYKKLGLKF
jgi:hypothetical protein